MQTCFSVFSNVRLKSAATQLACQNIDGWRTWEGKGTGSMAEMLNTRRSQPCLAGGAGWSGAGPRTSQPMGAPQHHSAEASGSGAAPPWRSRSSKSGETACCCHRHVGQHTSAATVREDGLVTPPRPRDPSHRGKATRKTPRPEEDRQKEAVCCLSGCSCSSG